MKPAKASYEQFLALSRARTRTRSFRRGSGCAFWKGRSTNGERHPDIPAVLCMAFALAGAARADLKAALAERDLGKRSKLALDNAGRALKTARAVSARAISRS